MSSGRWWPGSSNESSANLTPSTKSDDPAKIAGRSTTVWYYDRDGTPRFYGIGNHTPASAQTNYTNQQEFGQVADRIELQSHLAACSIRRACRSVDVLPGTLNGVASIETPISRGSWHQQGSCSIAYPWSMTRATI